MHTLCIPVTNSITEVFGAADQQAIVGLLAKMGKSSVFCLYQVLQIVRFNSKIFKNKKITLNKEKSLFYVLIDNM